MCAHILNAGTSAEPVIPLRRDTSARVSFTYDDCRVGEGMAEANSSLIQEKAFMGYPGVGNVASGHGLQPESTNREALNKAPLQAQISHVFEP